MARAARQSLIAAWVASGVVGGCYPPDPQGSGNPGARPDRVGACGVIVGARCGGCAEIYCADAIQSCCSSPCTEVGRRLSECLVQPDAGGYPVTCWDQARGTGLDPFLCCMRQCDEECGHPGLETLVCK